MAVGGERLIWSTPTLPATLHWAATDIVEQKRMMCWWARCVKVYHAARCSLEKEATCCSACLEAVGILKHSWLLQCVMLCRTRAASFTVVLILWFIMAAVPLRVVGVYTIALSYFLFTIGFWHTHSSNITIALSSHSGRPAFPLYCSVGVDFGRWLRWSVLWLRTLAVLIIDFWRMNCGLWFDSVFIKKPFLFNYISLIVLFA